MSSISEQEMLRRRRINQSVIGTNAMEGLQLDAETIALMAQYERGELSREQLSAEIDRHVSDLATALARKSARKQAVAGAA